LLSTYGPSLEGQKQRNAIYIAGKVIRSLRVTCQHTSTTGNFPSRFAPSFFSLIPIKISLRLFYGIFCLFLEYIRNRENELIIKATSSASNHAWPFLFQSAVQASKSNAASPCFPSDEPISVLLPVLINCHCVLVGSLVFASLDVVLETIPQTWPEVPHSLFSLLG
jgi:hypothetical protein